MLVAPNVELGTLNGINGFTLFGVDAADQSGDEAQYIGDINGDGFDDVMIGAFFGQAAGNLKMNAGEGYVVFGKADWSTSPTLELSTLNGTNGFTIFGAGASDYSHSSVSGAGDVNGDGFDDLLIGAYGGDALGNLKPNAGESYVVFGKADWSTSPTVDLATLNGTNGFTIFGVDVDDRSGGSVSGAGDVNGDGFDDLLIGADGGDALGNAKSYAGESYVVFGKANFSSRLLLSTLDGTNGFTIFGAGADDHSGCAVSGAGDVNGDGFNDLLIGAYGGDALGNAKLYAGESYVVFGKDNWSATPTLDLATLNGTNGFTLFGVDANDYSGAAVSGAGDVNGDGLNDLLIGADRGDALGNAKLDSGENYLVFGKADWSATSTLDLATLNGTDGFTLFGVDTNDYSGGAVSGAGDVNGDGFGDLLIGASGGDALGNSKTDSGESYLVFGQADWSATSTLDLATLNGTNGFTLFGVDAGDLSGGAVSGSGDVNGDGFDDLMIGAPYSAAAGNAKAAAGESYVVFGGNFTNSATTPDIVMNSVTVSDGKTTLTVNYQIRYVAVTSPLSLRFLRSTDELADAADIVLSTVTINNAADLTVGSHTLNFTIGTSVGSQVQLPGVGTTSEVATDYFILAVADPANAITEADSDPLNDDNTVAFVGAYATSTTIYVHGGTAADTVTLTYPATTSGNVTLGLSGSLNATSSYAYNSTAQFRLRTHGHHDAVQVVNSANLTARPMFELGGDGQDTLNGGAGADTLDGGLGNDSLQGGNGNDSLNGVSGNDTLRGGLGNDSLTGGVGNDSLDGSAGSDRLIETANDNFTLTNATLVVGAATDTLLGIESANLTGGIGNNTLTASAFTLGSVTLSGGSGNDSLVGTNFADSLNGGSGHDTLVGGLGNDSLTGGVGNDSLDGSAGTDRLIETADANFTLTNGTLVIGAETDTLSGIESANLTGGNGNNTLTASAFTLGSVTLSGGSGNDSLVGTNFADSLNGGSADDTLRGGLGNDSLTGGLGNDSLDGGAGTDRLIETADANFTLTNATLVIGAETDTLSGVESANLTGGSGNNTLTASAFTLGGVTLSGGNGNDSLVGTNFSDSLNGGSSHDTVGGGLGNDSLTGGVGNDSLDGGAGTDRLIETANANFTLTNATLVIGAETDTLSGIESANLTGGSGNNTLTASAFTLGGVTLSGGSGNDSLVGTDFADSLTGGTGNDTLTGGLGNDSLSGGLGTDSLDGGLGTDRLTETADANFTLTNTTLVIGTVTDTLSSIESANLTGGSGNNTLTASAFTLGGVTLSGGSGNDSLVGTDFSDSLNGGSGNDTLLGGLGNDSLIGDLGNDSLDGGAGTDRLIEGGNVNLTIAATSLTGLGTDTLVSGSLEEAVLTGGSSANTLTITTFAGAVTLQGLGGNDTLIGGPNADSLDGGDGNDSITGGGGNDTLPGGNGNDALDGGDGNDVMLGGAGRDLLIGGAGTDSLDGNAGDDILIGGTSSHSGNIAALNSIMAEWSSANNYSTRVANLQNGGGANGTVTLNSTTVQNDTSAADTLTGGADIDWFFQSDADVLTDFNAGLGEIITPI